MEKPLPEHIPLFGEERRNAEARAARTLIEARALVAKLHPKRDAEAELVQYLQERYNPKATPVYGSTRWDENS